MMRQDKVIPVLLPQSFKSSLQFLISPRQHVDTLLPMDTLTPQLLQFYIQLRDFFILRL